MANDLEQALGAIEARLAKATPGPWMQGYPNAGEVIEVPGDIYSAEKDLICTAEFQRDEELIANAPTDLARLVKALRLIDDELEKASREGNSLPVRLWADAQRSAIAKELADE